jgi:2-oxoglutarate dehydrogenase complex dehydrogenase (E1) component-like enzyme
MDAGVPRAAAQKFKARSRAMTRGNGHDSGAPTDTIAFDDAVREGRNIIATIEDAERGQLRLGELTDKLEPR